MGAGHYDRRIRIERPPAALDPDYGTPSGAWSVVATVSAQVRDVLPSKGEDAGQSIRIAEGPVRIRMRYLSGITADMRVVDIQRGNRVLKILTPPAELGRKRELEFMASEFSTAGNAA